METVLVTGSTGFIGQAVVRALLLQGMQVRALVRCGAQWAGDARVESVQGDVRDLASLHHAVSGVDAIVHLAARKSDEADSEAVNVGGARNLIAAARSAPVRVIVNVSTQSAKLTHKGLYGETKAEADRLFEASGLPVVTLRSSLVYGDQESGVFGTMVRFSKLPLIPVIGPGTAEFRPIHRDDLAQIIVRALAAPRAIGHMYDIGGPQALSFNDLTCAIVQAAGKRRLLVHIPVWAGLLLARACTFLPHPPLTVSNVLGGAEHVPMDIAPMLRDFACMPRPFSQGLEEIFPREDRSHAESRALLQYIALTGVRQWQPSMRDIECFESALGAHRLPVHFLSETYVASRTKLHALDAASRSAYPHSIVQQKLLVAAAIVECNPVSAAWLLPRDRSIARVVLRCTGVGMRTAMAAVRSIPLRLRPSSLARDAGA